MQLALQSLDNMDLPEDTYVSVRVGDQHKQVRYASSRNFLFKDSDEEQPRFGRIEVFRRVGSATVPLDSKNGGPHDFRLVCDIPGKSHMNMSLTVKKADYGGAAKEAKINNAKKARDIQNSVKKYLEEYRLEEALCDAMKQVIEKRPADPHAFVSAKILEARSLLAPAPSGGSTAKLPPLSGASKGAGAPMSEIPQRPAPGSKAVQPPVPEKLSNSAPRKLEPLARASAGDVKDIGDVREMKMLLLQTLGKSVENGELFAALEKAKTPSQVGEEESDSLRRQAREALMLGAQKGPAPSQSTGELDDLKQQARQVLTASAERGQLTNVLVQSRNQEAAPTPAAAASERLEIKRQAREVLVKSAQTGNLAQVSAQNQSRLDPATAKQQPPVATHPFTFLPSVGSWLSSRPARPPLLQLPGNASAQNQSPPDPATAKHQPPVATHPFTFLPSVGSWLSGRPARPQAGVPAGMPMAKLATETRPGLQLQSPPVQEVAFKHAPSVGTWLSKKPMQPPKISNPGGLAGSPVQELAFKHTPSVGTWLSKKPMQPPKMSNPVGLAGSSVQELAFKHTPSVGTWFSKKPMQPPKVLAAGPGTSLREGSAGAASSQPWKLKPSVGTWLAHNVAGAMLQSLRDSSSILKQRNSEIMTMGKVEIIEAFRKETERMEKEIQQLRAAQRT